jgi:predicted nucleotidyltransferase
MESLILDDKREELKRICERYGVSRLDLFGSAVGEAFDTKRSDLDFVVSFAPRIPARLFDRYFGLREELERLFGRGVDLVMEGAMKNPYFVRSVNESRVPLYAA